MGEVGAGSVSCSASLVSLAVLLLVSVSSVKARVAGGSILPVATGGSKSSTLSSAGSGDVSASSTASAVVGRMEGGRGASAVMGRVVGAAAEGVSSSGSMRS